MRYDNYVELLVPSRDHMSTSHHKEASEIAAYIANRVRNEGIIPIASRMSKSFKQAMACLGNHGTINESLDLLDLGNVGKHHPAWALDFLGAFSKLKLDDHTSQEDVYAPFLARNREVSNFAGCRWEDILPLPPGYCQWIARLLGPAPTTVTGRHGPGATAERLVGWDKWLGLDETITNSLRMTTVPKDWSKDRLIGIESVRAQFIQQGIARALRNTSFFRAFVSLRCNRRHLRLATDPEYMTIDLSDASDRIPLSLVEYLLPADWYYLFARYSTGTACLPTGEVVRLGMAATMGNGFCFEQETLIFLLVASLVSASTVHELHSNVSKTSVFGDDIVLRRAYGPEFALLATSMGWVLSATKTCWTSGFKETVGFWISNGHAVRRFLPKLAGDKVGIHFACSQEVLDLSERACVAGYEGLGRTLLSSTEFRTRHGSPRREENFQRPEISVSTLVAPDRRNSVSEETRYRAYWMCYRTQGRRELDEGLKPTLSKTWLPAREYPNCWDILCREPRRYGDSFSSGPAFS